MEDKTTNAIKRRYDRIAPFYDMMEGPIERSGYSRWRKLLWSEVEGKEILEVGVGTGKNFPYYPPGVNITAVDFSIKMLEVAQKRAAKENVKVNLRQMDVQNLEFADNTFDSIVGSFIFCSVPDPVLGLREVKRVLKQGGKLVLLEHVISADPIIARLMNLFNPVIVRLMGPNINRRTVDNVIESGLVLEQVTDLSAGIFKLIEARKFPGSF